MDGHSFQINQCISLNFGYHDDQLSIPQLSMTPDSNRNLNFDSPRSCIFVIIGGKYLDMVEKVMDSVGVGGTRPLAVFVMNNYNENLVVDINKNISTGVMVK